VPRLAVSGWLAWQQWQSVQNQRLSDRRAVTAGTPNFEVAMREWNHPEVCRKTILLMAQRLGGG